MSRKIICWVKFISFVASVILLANGCGNSSRNQNAAQSKNEFQETRSLIIPQYEIIETSTYRELKKQVEKTRGETDGLEIIMNRLKAVYTEEYPSVKKASNNFAEAKKKLSRLEKLLNAETEKLQIREINAPV